MPDSVVRLRADYDRDRDTAVYVIRYRMLGGVMRAAKVDANQAEIVAALRDVGASVACCHTVGCGFPDLVVGFRGQNILIEVKDGIKPKSARKLTKDQVKFHSEWRGQICVVKNEHEALAAIGV